PPRDASCDARMEVYNADGSRAQMCGNGIRCAGRLLHDRRRCRGETLRVETGAGVKTLRLRAGRDGGVEAVSVDMGPPRLRRLDLPLADGGDAAEPALGVSIDAGGRTFRFSGVSMGNPHAVIRVDGASGAAADARRALEEIPLERWGPSIERHPWFPERVNAEFIAVLSRSEIALRVWERGSGETLACGTGACAAAVAAHLSGWCDRRVLAHLRGGDLEIEWRGEESGGSVVMTGPAEEVFRGVYTDA
ncbi:MAG: diaminopimelate epimerase, partial [Planctomycetes bacterium]|nr:diaminopimelate epimerase [Planctomycetota bacterium]